MAHEAQHSAAMSYVDDASGERCNLALKLPKTQQDWHDKRAYVDAQLNEVGGVVVRVGDETIGELWSLWDGKAVLDEIDPQFGANVERHIMRALTVDPFHVSANTDPKGDRSKRPQEQDPDMLLHVVKETDAGIVVRGAKYETAAAYANQAFVKPTIANWGDDKLSDYAVGFIADMGWPGIKHICRTGFAGRAPSEDYPLSNRFDEVDTLIVFDDVLVPWENVLFYRHTRAATFIRATLHRYSAFPYTQRILYLADMLIGAALFNARQTGLDKQQAVREKLAELACYREGINAHLTAAIATAQPSPAGLLDAEPVAAVHRAGACLHEAAGDDASGARTVRRADLRHAGLRRVRRSGDQAVAREVLHRERGVERGRSPPPAGFRPRSAEFGLCRPSADVRAVRPVAALCASECGLHELRLRPAAPLRAAGGGSERPGDVAAVSAAGRRC